MRTSHLFSFLALILSSYAMGMTQEDSASSVSRRTTINIPMRSLTAIPSVGASAASVSDVYSPNYGALKIFMEKAAAYTHNEVTFSIVKWTPTAPNSVVQQVGINGDSRDAAYDLGVAMNPQWGFLYLSMAPFHLSYQETLDWLYNKGGLALAQSLLDKRNLNVKVIPVLGSNPQIGGWFKAPIGSTECDAEKNCEHTAPIGLEGLCTSGWTLRYLSPGQNVIDGACDAMVAASTIPAKNLHFIKSVPGVSQLGAVQSGAVTGFEQATPLDDLSQFFPDPGPAPILQSRQNPGHKGIRYLHWPSWQQPFLLGYIFLNKTTVWDTLSPTQQTAIERAGRDAVNDSFNTSASVQCDRLRTLLAINDTQVQLDPKGNPILDANGQPLPADLHIARYGNAAIQKLRTSNDLFLESLRGGRTPTQDQLEYRQVFDSILAYEHEIRFKWKPTEFPKECGNLTEGLPDD